MVEHKLGLIGVGISRSRAPELHRAAGKICGIDVAYDLIELELGDPAAFERAWAACCASGYRGFNVTYPFKERAAKAVQIASDQVRRLGAVNTVRFDDRAHAHGFNTDYTGFVRAFRSSFADRRPGAVALIGAGGVGRAIAFGLGDLGATQIRLFDQSVAKSEGVAAALGEFGTTRVVVCASLEQAVRDADGLINATPQGMYQYPASPLPADLIGGQSWAFDAVYTPAHTQFLTLAKAAGLQILYGYELFFFQGVDAFEIFTGVSVDQTRLREALALPSANVSPVA